ncbi:uncharacterized protein TRAVEDRAFT_54247 [Trametes versicolor FP-101664 SS1]|uniref:Uncharacterized protein n=1 Tax=Trametes versicolor (strain FP-101664) TaxID=717944 RepID=R7S790_TRAVS|nr:uncharacterized protein TRAVEDRAFT_54247 [Trametes versicolor FP-101664 SS1]EIW51821.1 hypothetical protein TRAVEDRAFT_54247 [Trametes versicolor FP-101664 SS1]
MLLEQHDELSSHHVGERSEGKQVTPPPWPAKYQRYTPIRYADLEPHLRLIEGNARPYLRFGVVVPGFTRARLSVRAQELLDDPEITTWHPDITRAGGRYLVESGNSYHCLQVIDARLRYHLASMIAEVFDVGYKVVQPEPHTTFYSFFTNRATHAFLQRKIPLDRIKRCVQAVKEAWGEESALEAMWYYDGALALPKRVPRRYRTHDEHPFCRRLEACRR